MAGSPSPPDYCYRQQLYFQELFVLLVILRSELNKLFIGPYQMPLYHNHYITTITEPILSFFLSFRPNPNLVAVTVSKGACFVVWTVAVVTFISSVCAVKLRQMMR